MKKFLTKFDMVPFNGSLMDPNDAVDRLSYVDSTQQIVRMLQAGVNLRMSRNQGYDDCDLNAPSMPIYAPDPAIAQRMINEMDDQLKANAKARSEQFEEYKKSLDEAPTVEETVTP